MKVFFFFFWGGGGGGGGRFALSSIYVYMAKTSLIFKPDQ